MPAAQKFRKYRKIKTQACLAQFIGQRTVQTVFVLHQA